MKQDNWLISKRSFKDIADLLFDSYYVYFCAYGLETLSNVLWSRTHHFQPFPVVHGPNPDHDPLSRLYVVLEL